MPRIYTKVAGVSFKNSNGVPRQWLISNYCRPGMRLTPIHEPYNKADKNAVGLYIKPFSRQVKIGHLKKELAAELHHLVNKYSFYVEITAITGSNTFARCHGVNICIGY